MGMRALRVVGYAVLFWFLFSLLAVPVDIGFALAGARMPTVIGGLFGLAGLIYGVMRASRANGAHRATGEPVRAGWGEGWQR